MYSAAVQDSTEYIDADKLCSVIRIFIGQYESLEKDRGTGRDKRSY